MKVEYLDPKEIVFQDPCPVDEHLKDSIQKEGFHEEYPGVRLREDGRFQVVRGYSQLRAVLSLIEEDADCYDGRTAHTVKASELYDRLPMCVFR